MSGSNGAGTGMHSKIKRRDDLLRRSLPFVRRAGTGASRDLAVHITCTLNNPAKVKYSKRVECDHHQIWRSATAHLKDDEKGAAIARNELISVPLGDLALLREKLTQLDTWLRNLDPDNYGVGA